MNKEKQRIAIAESQGWKRYNSQGTDAYHPDRPDEEFPDFLNDLNACHEFEETLFPDDAQYSQWNFYSSHLGELTNNDNGRGWDPLSNADCFRVAHATAAQRCEAFLKTLDLWEDAE